MENKQEFMLIFRFQPDFNYVPSPEELEQMGQQWGAYFGKLAGEGKLVSTHQLGFEGLMVAAGNLIVIADNIQEAVEIAKQSPILLMGGNVEVRSINPM